VRLPTAQRSHHPSFHPDHHHPSRGTSATPFQRGGYPPRQRVGGGLEPVSLGPEATLGLPATSPTRPPTHTQRRQLEARAPSPGRRRAQLRPGRGGHDARFPGASTQASKGAPPPGGCRGSAFLKRKRRLLQPPVKTPRPRHCLSAATRAEHPLAPLLDAGLLSLPGAGRATPHQGRREEPSCPASHRHRASSVGRRRTEQRPPELPHCFRPSWRSAPIGQGRRPLKVDWIAPLSLPRPRLLSLDWFI
jgi:hypothetical protein